MKFKHIATQLLIASMVFSACAPSVSLGAKLEGDNMPTPIPENNNLDPQLVWDLSCVGLLEGKFNILNIQILDPLIYFVGNDGYVPTLDESGTSVIPDNAWLEIDSSGPSINYKYKNPITGLIESNSITKDTQMTTPYEEEFITPSGEKWYLWVFGAPYYAQYIVNPEGPCVEAVGG